ncbi:hypothetical protein DAMA08_046410 [Martiniozyma asiatica (nom. inval.)]|nr:hypothetical protein DAMA08_046410 [Martiniozyma asiatica]
MEDFEGDISQLSQRIESICQQHKVCFYGVFSNKEGIEKTLSIGNPDYLADVNNSSVNISMSSLNLSLPAENALGVPFKTMQINPNEKIAVSNYLFNCFEEFQQIPCKLLAKAWIKIIEPKKQSTFPYKQGELSKPYWWPHNSRHKEPDHLKKNERINLLKNILKIFKNKESELLYAATMVNELSPKNKATNSGDDFGLRKLSILKDMFRVVKNGIQLNQKSMTVIKPGKKFSSQIYQGKSTKGKLKLKARVTVGADVSWSDSGSGSNGSRIDDVAPNTSRPKLTHFLNDLATNEDTSNAKESEIFVSTPVTPTESHENIFSANNELQVTSSGNAIINPKVLTKSNCFPSSLFISAPGICCDEDEAMNTKLLPPIQFSKEPHVETFAVGKQAARLNMVSPSQLNIINFNFNHWSNCKVPPRKYTSHKGNRPTPEEENTNNDDTIIMSL